MNLNLVSLPNAKISTTSTYVSPTASLDCDSEKLQQHSQQNSQSQSLRASASNKEVLCVEEKEQSQQRERKVEKSNELSDGAVVAEGKESSEKNSAPPPKPETKKQRQARVSREARANEQETMRLLKAIRENCMPDELHQYLVPALLEHLTPCR
jgi:hypothetical protein